MMQSYKDIDQQTRRDPNHWFQRYLATHPIVVQISSEKCDRYFSDLNSSHWASIRHLNTRLATGVSTGGMFFFREEDRDAATLFKLTYG